MHLCSEKLRVCFNFFYFFLVLITPIHIPSGASNSSILNQISTNTLELSEWYQDLSFSFLRKKILRTSKFQHFLLSCIERNIEIKIQINNNSSDVDKLDWYVRFIIINHHIDENIWTSSFSFACFARNNMFVKLRKSKTRKGINWFKIYQGFNQLLQTSLTLQ